MKQRKEEEQKGFCTHCGGRVLFVKKHFGTHGKPGQVDYYDEVTGNKLVNKEYRCENASTFNFRHTEYFINSEENK